MVRIPLPGLVPHRKELEGLEVRVRGLVGGSVTLRLTAVTTSFLDLQTTSPYRHSPRSWTGPQGLELEGLDEVERQGTPKIDQTQP